MSRCVSVSDYQSLGEGTDLWIRMYASWAVHLGFSPSFLRALLKESVLEAASTTIEKPGVGWTTIYFCIVVSHVSRPSSG